jgi:hypothetical protein
MIGLQTNDELEGIWKEAIVISWYLPSRTEENRGRPDPVPAEIQTEHLPTTSQELCRCATYYHIAASFSHFSLMGFGNFTDKYSSNILRSNTTEYFNTLVNIKALFYWIYFMCWAQFRRRPRYVSSEYLVLPPNGLTKAHWGCHGSEAVAIPFMISQRTCLNASPMQRYTYVSFLAISSSYLGLRLQSCVLPFKFPD